MYDSSIKWRFLITLPTNENWDTTQAMLSSRSLLESHKMRQEITESVMKESAAELANGIQHRQKMENAISVCKLKQTADYLVICNFLIGYMRR